MGADYAHCLGCGSLFYTRAFAIEDYTSAESPTAFYGAQYWQEHVPNVLGLPGLAERARSDLAERAVYYLERTLEYLAPGSEILELGCAPGSFAYLLNQAGMKVTGLEASDHAAEFVRRTFGLDVHCGTLEQSGMKQQFEAIVMVDVLEHLPRPLETLKACVDRLQGDGVLLLQTPCYRGEGTAWPMLLPAEHLYLYTAESVRALLERAGFTVIEVTHSLFPHDMWVVASLSSSLPKRAEPLEGVAPLAVAMIRLSDRLASATEQQAATDRDRAAKDEVIAQISGELETVRADQRAKEELIVRISGEIEALLTDQRAKEGVIARLTKGSWWRR
ncbi:MAG: class I SAM-dependent methyltransferase [Acidobacteria bacterium]|nr:class I SAM-dependent methyltransferase [Acidobacteriota bacterium]